VAQGVLGIRVRGPHGKRVYTRCGTNPLHIETVVERMAELGLKRISWNFVRVAVYTAVAVVISLLRVGLGI
jgi:hypothetical protein